MSFLSSFLWDFLYGMLNLLGLSRLKEDPNHLKVFIQTNQGRRVMISLDPIWTMAEVKRQLSTQLLLPANEIRIILAGQALGDEVRVGDCDIGQSTVLHAVKIVHKPQEEKKEETEQPLNQSLLDLQLSQGEKKQLVDPEERKRHRAHFYVYCGVCKGMQPGKLRVKCSRCGNGAILVDRDPADWQDVLERERIYGDCQSGQCDEDPIAAVEFFFKCASHPSSAEDEATPPLYLVKSNLHDIPCLACGDEKVDPVLVFDCEDRHVICVECFVDYCRSRLNERQFKLDDELGYTLPCAIRCENSLIVETRHFKLLGDADYERYQRFGAEECVLQAGGVLCPQPGCGMGILQEQPCRKVVCEKGGCGYVFCRDCLQGFHIGDCQSANGSASQEQGQAATSGVTAASAAQSRWVNADPSSLAIRLTTKPCPKCRTATERSGGCMHMICTKASCGFQWCWICQTEWTRDCMASHWFG